MIYNTRYAIGDSDGGEGGAISESIISNARYAIRDGDGGERGATRESIPANARYIVGCAVVGNGFRNYYRTRIFVIITSRDTSSISYRSGLGRVIKIIPDTIDLRIGGIDSIHAGDQRKEKSKKFLFHNN